MQKRKALWSLWVLFLLIAGCSGDSNGETGTTTTAEVDEVEATTTVAAGVDGLDIDLDGSVEEIYAQMAELPADERFAYTLERALEEGSLTLYTVSNLEHTEATIAQFEALYDIDVEFIRLEDNVISDRIILENQAGQHLVDVIDVSGPDAVRLQDEGMFAALSGAPVLPDNFPETAVSEFSVVHQTNAILSWWRTDRVSPEEAPTGIDDFLDPVWHGRVGITAFPDDLTIALLEERGEEQTRQFLTGLVIDNEAQVRQGHSGSTAALIAGEFDAHVALLASVSIPRMEEGAPIDWGYFPPYAVNAGVTYIYTASPNPFASLLWIHFKSSLEGQQGDADRGSPAIHPDAVQAFEAYAEMNQRLIDGQAMILTNEIVAEHREAAESLIEEIVVPRLRE